MLTGNDALLPLALCVAIGLLWYVSMRARERATAHAQRLCNQYGAQMLDQSVVLHGLRPLWRAGKLRLLRSYRFDLSYAGNDRHRASLTLAGDRLIDYSLPTRQDPRVPAEPARSEVIRIAPAPRSAGDIAVGNNVIPITRAKKTLH